MAKNIPDEVIVAELLNSVSIRAAAKKLELQERTIYDRMKKPEFKKLYADARADVISHATARLQNFANQAVSCLALVMSKQEYAPQVRVNAADCLLRYCLKFSEKADITDKIEALEKVLDPLSQSLHELATTQLESDDLT
jgi:transposase